MPAGAVTVTIEVDGYEDAQRLALAVTLLRWYGRTYGDEQAVAVADDAAEALENLDMTTDQQFH